MRFKTGLDRNQVQFFTRLNDLVVESHYVRLIDLFVDGFMEGSLDKFERGKKRTGRKAYHPGTLLKIYIYGYLNSVSSSRKLEKECHRNLEMIWLTGYLVPDHKTISDFRKDNNEGILGAFNSLNLLLKSSGYIKGETISVDGSKIRANAAMSIDLQGLENKLENLEIQLSGYLSKLDSMDSYDDELAGKKHASKELDQKIAQLKEEVEKLKEQKKQLEKQGTKRLNLTDPDARLMKSRQGRHFSYNMQASVDAENQMFATVYTVGSENDKNQLLPMANSLKNELDIVPRELLADAGYYVINQLETLESKGINCFVPIQPNQQAAKGNFQFNKHKNHYTCEQGEILKPKNGTKRDLKRGTVAKAYQGINCGPCKVKPNCTSAKARTVYRYSNQKWRDEYDEKLKSRDGKLKLIQRKSLSEHPFGTIKYWMGQIPLKTRGLKQVNTEINLYALGYNLKRLINIESFDRIKELFKLNRKQNLGCT